MHPRYTAKPFRYKCSIVVSVAATFVLFLLPVKVLALSCAYVPYTLHDAYELADSIIVGIVTGCEGEISNNRWTSGGSDCSFESLEVLKEASPSRDYAGVVSSSGCGLALQEGNQYLLFLDRENKPIHPSVILSDEPDKTQMSGSYLRILREFREGVTRDLSGPWMFSGQDGTCSLVHRVGGHQIAFGHNNVDAQNWSRETIDGKTTYRGWTRSQGTNSSSLPLYIEAVVVGDAPEYPLDAQTLTVSLNEQTPVPLRQVTLTVGSRDWQLYRVEASVTIDDMPAINLVRYQVGGEVVEDILSAMSNPSDVVVSAVLVTAPNDDSEPASDTHQSDPEYVTREKEPDAYVSSVSPELGLAVPDTTARAGVVGAYRSRRELSAPEIRLETRSTQLLPAVIKSYRACYYGGEP